MYVQVPLVVMNLIFLYSVRVFTPLVPILWSINSGGLGERLPIKTEVKKLLSTLAFSSSVDTRLLFLLIRGSILYLNLPFLADIPVEALLVIPCIPCQILLQLHPGPPDSPSLHNRAASLYFIQGTCPCFHCLCSSLLPFSLTIRSRLVHASLLPSFPVYKWIILLKEARIGYVCHSYSKRYAIRNFKNHNKFLP